MATPGNWICDTCGKPIASAGDGLVIWKTDKKLRRYSFKIVHKGSRGKSRCDKPDHIAHEALTQFLGADGLNYCLSMLSLGPILRKSGNKEVLKPKDLDGFVDFVRRVQLPNYEQARQRFGSEEVLDRYSDNTEEAPYTQSVLARIAKNAAD